VDRIEALVRDVAEIEGSCVDEAWGALLNVERRGYALLGMQGLVREMRSMCILVLKEG